MLEHNPRKIAVLRANGLGDFIMATPALRALAKGFPDARITYLTQPALRGFIAGRYPYLHRVEAIPPYPNIRQPAAREPQRAESADAFFQRMSAEHFDLAIQMHGGGADSNPFLTKLQAAHTVGLTALGSLPLEQNLRYIYYQNEIIRYLELVGKLGVPPDGLGTDVPVLPEDRHSLARAFRPAEQPYVVLHMGAGDVRRRWPAQKFARVAEHIHGRTGHAVVLTGGPDERALAESFRLACSMPGVVDLVGQLGLGALAALLSKAALMVSNDTGPAHMAYALGTPSVVVFWCGNLINAGPLKRERFRPVLSWTLRCPVCGSRDRCNCPASWVADVGLEEVLANVDDLLA